MSQMLLVNPRRRRRAVAKKRRASPKRRRNPIAVRTVARAPARRSNPRRRRRNPITLRAPRVAARRSNPRRRRNPISLGIGSRSIVSLLKDAAIGGAGAISVDVLMGYVNPYLPATLRTQPNAIGAGDAVKAAITVLAGKLLSKPTRGLSQKMAMGALITQARDIMATFVPATMTLGYAVPGRVVNGNQRIGPVRRNISAYERAGGRTPLLSAYVQPGATTLLNSARGGVTARAREGYVYR